MKDTKEKKLREIVASFKSYGVKKIGPTHCIGEIACQLFNQTFGENIYDVKVGSHFEL